MVFRFREKKTYNFRITNQQHMSVSFHLLTATAETQQEPHGHSGNSRLQIQHGRVLLLFQTPEQHQTVEVQN